MIKRGEHINRNNYEEFFLLYIDGELTVIEQIAVDTFLSRTPDLQEEFNILKSAIIAPEKEITFDKSFLFKNAESAINTQNFEEKFLLYVDNELGESEKAAIETFVLQHPAMQEAFTVLKQTKLAPEAIQFPDKSTLYRKERKVVYMQWLRIAVAAVFIGLCYNWVGNLITNSNGNINGSVATTFTKEKPIKKEESTAVIETKKQELPINNPASTKNNSVSTVYQTKKKVPIEDVVTVATIKERNGNLKEKKNISYAASYHEAVKATQQSVPYNQLPIKDSEALVSRQLPNKTRITTPAKPENKIFANNEVTNSIIPSKGLAQSTIYKDLDETNDDSKITVGNVNISREKLKGILQKAAKLFERKHKAIADSTKR